MNVVAPVGVGGVGATAAGKPTLKSIILQFNLQFNVESCRIMWVRYIAQYCASACTALSGINCELRGLLNDMNFGNRIFLAFIIIL